MERKFKKKVIAVFLSAAVLLSGVNSTGTYAEATSTKAVVKLNKTKVSVKKGKKVTIKIVKSNVKKITSKTWSSKNENIATVNSKGTVTGKKAGKSTTVTCKVKYTVKGSSKVYSKNLKCTVTVKKDTSTTSTTETPSQTKTEEELYKMAVKDAAFAEEDEIKPLVSLTKDDELVTWDDKGRVLLCTWHSYPDSYPEGETVTTKWGSVWVYTDKEMASYAEELKNAKDPVMRLRQLISISPGKTHSTVTGMWVKPSDVIRPAYQTDATDGRMFTAFEDVEKVDGQFKEWFDQNILNSYFYGEYPWTRLGYTYDWADNGKEYGLTEFLVKQNADVEVAFTETTDEFLQRICK